MDLMQINPIEVPIIHEEPVAGLISTLALEPAGDELIGRSLPQVFSHVYGGQVIAQAMLAAAAVVRPDRVNNPHSLHVKFLRAGETDQPISYEPLVVHGGKSFESVQVTARQGDREMMVMFVSFQREQEGPAFSPAAPEVPGPDGLRSNLEVFRLVDNPVSKFLGKSTVFEARHIDGNVYVRTQPAGAHRIWIRPRTQVEVSQVVGRAMLAYAVDQLVSEPLLRASGLSWSSPGLLLASLDHAMWFHRDFDVNQWVLLDLSCQFAGGARGLSAGRIFTQDGELIASLSQEAMIRVVSEGGTWSFDGRGIPQD